MKVLLGSSWGVFLVERNPSRSPKASSVGLDLTLGEVAAAASADDAVRRFDFFVILLSCRWSSNVA
jgi:hypothetical protein